MGHTDSLVCPAGSVVWLCSMWDLSSLTGNQTLVSCIDKRILYHWATRKALIIYLINKIFWLCYAACGILVLQPGIKSTPPALRTRRLNHWTIREVPGFAALNKTNQPVQSRFLVHRTWGIFSPPSFKGHPGLQRLDAKSGVFVDSRRHGDLAEPVAQESWTQASQKTCSRKFSWIRRNGREEMFSKVESRVMRFSGDEFCVVHTHVWR